MKRIAATRNNIAVVLMDEIAAVGAEEAGAVVVCASHGEISSARCALGQPLRAVFFNDAGVGKDEAGSAGLALKLLTPGSWLLTPGS